MLTSDYFMELFNFPKIAPFYNNFVIVATLFFAILHKITIHFMISGQRNAQAIK